MIINAKSVYCPENCGYCSQSSISTAEIEKYPFISKEIRISGGREINLGGLQPLGIYAANSIFLGNYLTTEGQEKNQDLKMLEDLGFEIEIMPKQEEIFSS
ncbi:hypothetical protein JMM81_17890 [Bacillus sp. V3B]|nr:hypothetical protein [Bacillus sp. V3B]